MDDRKKIVEMSSSEARKFLLKPQSYVPLKLPEYFDFSGVIDEACKKLKGHNLNDLIDNKLKPKDIENVNYTILINKDGKYDWRPITIVHPMLYVNLVNLITEKDNWKLVTEKFIEYQNNPKIKCISLPIESKSKKTDLQVTILNWWENLEQASIKLSLDFEYCVKTDITNCYGSLYTHTIPWAIHGKDESKKNRKSRGSLGNKIDKIIQDMQYGQTNGIPQGGVLFDLISEIVLGYADTLLTDELNNLHVKNYQIIRYRDDYRIFANSNEDANIIVRALSDVLADLNMHFNSKKTEATKDIIGSSIKKDKLYWMAREDIVFSQNLEKSLIQIFILSKKYPNSGSVMKALSEYQKKIMKLKKLNRSPRNVDQLIAILADIMVTSPKSMPNCIAILSNIFEHIDENRIITFEQMILQKLSAIPNIGHTEIWLQRLLFLIEAENFKFKDELCNKASDGDLIWNSDWLDDKFDESTVFNKEIAENLSLTIPFDQVNFFEEYPF